MALTEIIDPVHAPAPANDAERLVFRHLYETLVRADCAGAILPGLAVGWRTSDGGRTWTFRLRDGAAFWDGRGVGLTLEWDGTPRLTGP